MVRISDMCESFLRIYLMTLFLGFMGVWCHRGPLRFNPEGMEFVKHVNESFYISCFHENGTDFWWYNDFGQPISEDFRRVHVERENSFSFKGAALVFPSIQSNDKGNYTCKARISGRSESLSFVLITYRPITFRDTPSTQIFGELETGVIRCDAEGEPEPTISWFVNGRPVENSTQYKAIGDGLLIANVSLEDAKQDFVCRAAAVNNITSNIALRNIKLNILHSPKLVYTQSILYGYTGGKVNITCEVQANPAANFTWFRNNTRYFGEVNSTIFYEKNKSVLRISYVDSSILGEYRCRATNERGSTDGTFLLKEIPRPEPPKKAKVHSMTHNSLQLEIHGPASREHEITGYRVQIMERKEKDTGKHWEVAREVFLPRGKPFIISDLKPNTEYVVRVTSQNEAGSGNFTHEIKTKTLSSASNSSNFSLSKALTLLVFFSMTFSLL